ncbi:MAG: PAS domain S-box protein [Chloroflexi bacterium]|nr:PAS domain S-box protein [Chloroflexota bacterium]
MSILQPPVFDDEEKTRRAYLLHIILWALILVPIPYLGYILVGARESIGRALIQAIFGETVNFLLLFLMRRGRVREASALQVLLFWLFFTVTAVTANGVQDEAYIIGYPLVILIAGLLMGPRLAVVSTVFCLLAGLGMVMAQNGGLIDNSQLSPPTLTWVISLAFFPVIATLQSLTARTMREASLRARISEERYRLISGVISDYAFESVMETEDQARTVWMAGAFEKMTGYSPEEYISTGGWYAHIHPDDLGQDAKDMERLLNNQDVQGSEIRTFTKTGEIRWERIFAHPIWDHKKNRLKGIVGAVQDITEQKEAEKKLRESLLQQSAILNNIPDTAWLKDLEGRYIAVNNEFLRISKRAEEEVIGKTDPEVWSEQIAGYNSGDDGEVIRAGMSKSVEEKQVDGAGREYWVEIIKTPIRDKQGTVIGVTGIARNITNHKQQELEQTRLIAELEAKNAELERFTYTVSHDLKSPLVTINGFLGYIENGARSGKTEQVSRDLNRIREAVDKMQTLLNDLLELSRVGRIVNKPATAGFGSIVQGAIAQVQGSIQSRGAAVEFMDGGHMVFGDRVRLMEVIQNLLENAVKFMGDQPAPAIRIGSFAGPGGEIIFFVEDNGIGIEPQYQERIFGLFNKLDTNTEGTGIGLALVKRIIEVHNGRIWLESQPGRGSTFYFTLPITK